MLLTIISALNGYDPSIEETAESLPLQSAEIEWIVKTNLEYVDLRLSRLIAAENIRVIARSDDSIYQALNQALTFAKGKYFIVLGAGDRLRKDSAFILLETIRAASGNALSVFFPILMKSQGVVFAARPQLLHTGMTTPHPGAALLTDKVLEIGGFDERYRIAADYDLLCRYVKKWPQMIISNSVVIDFKGGGISDTNIIESSIEAALVRHRNFS
jgi:hypothetical protein